MAFQAKNMQCVAVGPTKLWIYKTEDVIATSVTTSNIPQFNTTNIPGLSAGDIIMVAHSGNTLLAIGRMTSIDADSGTWTGITALA